MFLLLNSIDLLHNEGVMTVDGLKCFVEAARLLNFRSAAKAVALSPAALMNIF